MSPASAEPVFYWKGHDGDAGKMPLFRSFPYYSPDRLTKYTAQEITGVLDKYERGAAWPYDCLIAEDSYDFSVPHFENVEGIKSWNEQYANPVLISGTFTMFFDDVRRQADTTTIKVFDQDAPNAWADQDATDGKLMADARLLNFDLPTVEKLSTLAYASGGKGYPWKEIWQSYHKLISYHEHTNGAFSEEDVLPIPLQKTPKAANPNYYESEQVMHKGLVAEAREFARSARSQAVDQFTQLITDEPRQHGRRLQSSEHQALRLCDDHAAEGPGRDAHRQRIGQGDTLADDAGWQLVVPRERCSIHGVQDIPDRAQRARELRRIATPALHRRAGERVLQDPDRRQHRSRREHPGQEAEHRAGGPDIAVQVQPVSLPAHRSGIHENAERLPAAHALQGVLHRSACVRRHHEGRGGRMPVHRADRHPLHELRQDRFHRQPRQVRIGTHAEAGHGPEQGGTVLCPPVRHTGLHDPSRASGRRGGASRASVHRVDVELLRHPALHGLLQRPLRRHARDDQRTACGVRRRRDPHCGSRPATRNSTRQSPTGARFRST